MPNHRISYWDNFKGLLIVLVVFAHILLSLPIHSNVLDHVIDFIYMFHMPAFVFISGFFGKSERARSWQSLGKLLFLFFIFNSFMGFFYGLEPLFVPKYSYWYLLALVVWRVLTPYLASFASIQIFLLAVALLAGFFSSIDNTFSLARVICFYPYYMAGYLLSHQQAQNLATQPYIKRLGRGVLFLAVAAVSAVWLESLFHYSNESLQMQAYTNLSNGAIARLGLYAVAFTAILSLRYLVPKVALEPLALFGRNSLWIFLFHRPLTLWLAPLFPQQSNAVIILMALVSTLLLCLIFGNNRVALFMEHFATDGINLFSPNKKTNFNTAKLMTLCVCVGFLCMMLQRGYAALTWADVKRKLFEQEATVSVLTPTSFQVPQTLSAQQQKDFEQAFHITFAGDLILLEDQVKRGYRANGYDFSDVFEYAADYISSADFAIGVFEGPMAGEDAGYSAGNYDDGKELFLNFPDEFAHAVKEAGFDLVTTANNHLLDKGIDGALRTLEVLDKIGLAHTGSYRDEKEKEAKHIKLVEKDGIKMAILSYTYGSNYVDTQELFEGKLSYLTSVISDTKGELFEKMKNQVKEDFKKAKSLKPDLIVVLPHLGTQFSNAADEVQKKWFEIFKEQGADIILGDHPHAVQPVLLEKRDGKNVLTAYCPGNFANIYRQNQGDTSVLIDVYLHRSTKQIIGAGVVPLYTQASADGNYRALPIYEMLYNQALRKQLSTDDLQRAKIAHGIITEVLFGTPWDISAITRRYYMNENGFLREKQKGLTLTQEMQESPFLQKLNKVDSLCFVGDSVTEGTKNAGYPWFEPIEPFLSAKHIYNHSQGGATVGDILAQADQIPSAQAYVIALGTNDVRYHQEDRSAKTPQEFIDKIHLLKEKLKEKSPEALFVFIAPWYSTDGDPFSTLKFKEKTIKNEQYALALQDYCQKHQDLYINPNPYIAQVLQKYPQHNYLLDHIHPNSAQGIVLYARAVLLAR